MTEPSPTQYIPPNEPPPRNPPAVTEPKGPATGTSGMAIAAMVMGICGILLCPLVLSIPAIVFGALAMKECDRNPELEGKGMAIAGLVTGIVGTTLSVIFIIIAIAVGVAEDNDTNHHPHYWSTPPAQGDYDLH